MNCVFLSLALCQTREGRITAAMCARFYSSVCTALLYRITSTFSSLSSSVWPEDCVARSGRGSAWVRIRTGTQTIYRVYRPLERCEVTL
ncbi:hypothetical protein WMY93_031271, partial [Mugilogobius chulae]